MSLALVDGDMDGDGTVRVLKEVNARLRTMLLVDKTALKQEAGVAEVAGAGVDRLLTKPFTALSLLREVEEVLAEAGGGL